MPLFFRCALALSCLLVSAAAGAQGFSALVSPPRFEANAKAGATYRNVIEISNVSINQAAYSFETADWTLDASGNVAFSEELAPGTCRPWVGLEAARLTLGANAKRRFRFEVAVPADAPSGECRFAIMIEGDPESAKGSVPVPVTGRIGVIVYLTIGEAAAKLVVVAIQVQPGENKSILVMQVRNAGSAHGRLEGLVDGTDASGRKYSFAPSNMPILIGETRAITLTPEAEDANGTLPSIAYPLRLKGRLDSGTQRVDIDTTVTQ